MPLIEQLEPPAAVRQFARFLVCGGCAAAINWLSRFCLEKYMSFGCAVLVGYLVGMFAAFLLFRLFVFPRSSYRVTTQVKYFAAVNLVGIVQVWIVSITLVYVVFPTIGFAGSLVEPVGHGLAIAVPTISSYFGHRYLTFK
jgi:putative flippase GtrA